MLNIDYKLIQVNSAKPLKASSLTNAILVCLVISIFCGCLVLISQYQNLLNRKLYLQEELIGRNHSAFNNYINNLESLKYDENIEIDLFDDGIISIISKKNWGFYDVLISKTIFKNDTLIKVALIGQSSNESSPIALYVTDYDKSLKLSGKTELSGQLNVPNGHTEQAYFNGPEGNSIKIKGQQLTSGDKLPKIDKDISIDLSRFKQVQLDNVKNQKLINSFDKETIVLNLNGISTLSDFTCKGNVIITSTTPLKIANTVHLNDVLLVAPRIIFETGFDGNVQVIGKQEVELEEDVNLRYPSSIYIKNDSDSVTVKIKKNATIIGGIVIDGDTYTGSLKRMLLIDEKARVIGTVFNYGKTQLQGEIIGSLLTDRFFLKTNSSDYENVILNGIVNRDSLPKGFIELPLLKGQTSKYEYGIIKEF